MFYSPITEEQKIDILNQLGFDKIDDLFSDIPKGQISPEIRLPPPLSELELTKVAKNLASRNLDPNEHISFLGAGSYDHFIPSVIRHLSSRGEFMSAYTPYQPEISQGTLRVIYEFQTMVCELTGMDIANASLYDGATAIAEACIMAAAETGRKKILVPSGLHPHYLEVLQTYLFPKDIGLEVITSDVFYHFNESNFKREIREDVAAVVLPYPDFFGNVFNYSDIIRRAHNHGSAVIMQYDPIAMALFKTPGELGADIAVAEGQCLGIPKSFGGPGLGLLSAKEKYIRFLPGRIVGKTTDTEGKTGYVLTFQTREQHIRREKSLSNICTNQGLVALAATIYMAYMGANGIRRVAELCYKKATYLKQEISAIPGCGSLNTQLTFKEFLVSLPRSAKEVLARLKERNIVGGLDMSRHYKGASNILLVCATEQHSQREIDYLIKTLKDIL